MNDIFAIEQDGINTGFSKLIPQTARAKKVFKKLGFGESYMQPTKELFKLLPLFEKNVLKCSFSTQDNMDKLVQVDIILKAKVANTKLFVKAIDEVCQKFAGNTYSIILGK